MHAQTVSAAAMQEQAAASAFDRVHQNPLLLESFLRAMPKGGELHMHLSGAVYAETFIRQAAEDHMCIDPASYAIVASQTAGGCATGQVPAESAFSNPGLYSKLVDTFSMRAFVPSAGISGHDHFFAVFPLFEAIPRSRWPEWVDEVAARAASQNENYLEIMNTPQMAQTNQLALQIDWPTDPAATPDFALARKQLLAQGLQNAIPGIRKEIADFDAARRAMEHCGTSAAAPACGVDTRFIFQVLRTYPTQTDFAHTPQAVFSQILLGFETVAAEQASGHPYYVGINLVQPEDAYISMRDYTLQMKMIEYLHTLYPTVHISLHAGELAPGLVPPDGLRFHIRQAVELAHAERIGHGVDVMHENNPDALLAEMARKHILVEINLTSNDVILGVTGIHHPLPEYLAAHVPVALSTDDEGVSRIDLTHEYLRASTEYGLTYRELKQMARASLEHSFLPGDDLWSAPDTFLRIVAPCSGQRVGAATPTAACSSFLAANPRAAAQWELESRYRVFESSFK